MEALCYPGLQGFPVRVRGWAALQTRSAIVQPNDIHLQFSTSQVPLQYDKQTGSFDLQGSSTFFMNGTQFSVVDARLCAPQTEQPNDFSGQVFAEFHIWGINRSSPQLAVCIIPIQQRPTATPAGQTITDAVRGLPVKLFDMVPKGKDVSVLKYTTCLELDTTARPRVINCAVAYWTKGASITSAQQQQIMSKQTSNTLSPFGIPDILNGRTFLTNFQLQADGTKTGREYLTSGSIRLVYPSREAFDATSQNFQSSFGLIESFTQQSKSAGQDTSSLKCIAIQPSRDIQDGKLMIDPASGVRLDETVAEANQEAKLNPERVEASIGAGDIWMTVVTILGIFLGITAIAACIYIAHKYLLNRSSQGLPPVPPELASHLAGIQKIVGTQ